MLDNTTLLESSDTDVNIDQPRDTGDDEYSRAGLAGWDRMVKGRGPAGR